VYCPKSGARLRGEVGISETTDSADDTDENQNRNH